MNSRLLKRTYSYGLLAPGILIYLVIFALPTVISFYFAMTRWNLTTAEWIGFSNFVTFFSQENTRISVGNTFLFAFVTTVVKAVAGLALAVAFCRKEFRCAGYIKGLIYFPVMLSAVTVGIAFSALMHPSKGVLNDFLGWFGVEKIRWLTDGTIALWSVMLVDFWKTVGINVVIFIAGISAIPPEYYEAASIDGASGHRQFFHITLPLIVPSINSAITLSLIGGLKNYDLIWTMTEGGPGYSTEVLGTVAYKLFARGNFGLATAGQVVIFVLVCVIVFPINSYISKKAVIV